MNAGKLGSPDGVDDDRITLRLYKYVLQAPYSLPHIGRRQAIIGYASVETQENIEYHCPHLPL